MEPRGPGRADRVPAGSSLVDAHAHLPAAMPLGEALDAAAANARSGARRIGLASPGPAVLFLAEAPGQLPFDALERMVERQGRPARWSLHPTREDCSLVARREDGATLVLVAGSQRVTAEGLEVLVFGTRRHPAEGTPLRTILDRVGGDALTVLPWGFGKWWFGRGREARRALLSGRWPLLAGDTPHRPAAGPQPRLLREARARGIPVLPGSDPPPVPGGHRTLARYGFVHVGALPLSAPAAEAVARLRRAGRQPPVFGSPGSTWRVVYDQARMQLRKRVLAGRSRVTGPRSGGKAPRHRGRDRSRSGRSRGHPE